MATDKVDPTAYLYDHAAAECGLRLLDRRACNDRGEIAGVGGRHGLAVDEEMLSEQDDGRTLGLANAVGDAGREPGREQTWIGSWSARLP